MENKNIKIVKETENLELVNDDNSCKNELHWMLFITPLAGVTGIYA